LSFQLLSNESIETTQEIQTVITTSPVSPKRLQGQQDICFSSKRLWLHKDILTLPLIPALSSYLLQFYIAKAHEFDRGGGGVEGACVKGTDRMIKVSTLNSSARGIQRNAQELIITPQNKHSEPREEFTVTVTKRCKKLQCKSEAMCLLNLNTPCGRNA